MKNLNQIWKILPNLRGLAIICVIFAHSSIRVLIARNVETLLFPINYIFPNEFWVVLVDLPSFCVPLFFFLAGYFLGNSFDTWKATWRGLRKLLFPYIFYSICYFAISWMLGFGDEGLSVKDFLLRIIQGKISVYWFIFLLIQYYILAKWIATAVKNWPRTSLVCTFILQMGIMIWNYFSWFTFLESNGNSLASDLFFPSSFAPNFIFYIATGMWVRQYPNQIKIILQNKLTRIVIIIGFVVGIISVSNETLWMYNKLYHSFGVDLTSSILIASSSWKISLFLYSVSTILMLLFLGQLWLPSSKTLTQIGMYAYTIYLTHMFLADPIYWIIKHIYPPLLVEGISFIIHFVFMITVPIIFSKIVKKFVPRFSFILLGD